MAEILNALLMIMAMAWTSKASRRLASSFKLKLWTSAPPPRLSLEALQAQRR